MDAINHYPTSKASDEAVAELDGPKNLYSNAIGEGMSYY